MPAQKLRKRPKASSPARSLTQTACSLSANAASFLREAFDRKLEILRLYRTGNAADIHLASEQLYSMLESFDETQLRDIDRCFVHQLKSGCLDSLGRVTEAYLEAQAAFGLANELCGATHRLTQTYKDLVQRLASKIAEDAPPRLH